MGLPLKGQEDVDEGGKRLNKRFILSMVQEVALTALILWIPRDYIKLRAFRGLSTTRGFRGAVDASKPRVS